MKIIFLGLMYSETSFKEAYRDDKVKVQVAPQVFQSNLLSGFDGRCDHTVKVINVPPTGSFPMNNRRLFFKKILWGKENVQIGFINLPFIKHVPQRIKILKEVVKTIKKEKDVGIVIYTLYKPFMQVAKTVKKRFPNVPITLIQTDPVPGRDESKNPSSKKIKKGNELVKLAKACDSFVVLTKYLNDALEVGDRPSIVMECVSDSKVEMASLTDGKEKACLYAGGLWPEYGINDLVDAFKITKEGELWLCGGGGSVDYIKDACKNYPNIKFLGFVDRDEIKRLQNQADFMINPRRPTGTFTKHSFPSKTVEYMATAKPTIMYKLEGVPDEYDNYLNYLTGDTPEKIATELKKLFSSDYQELLNKAQAGRDFVLTAKSPSVQVERILQLQKRNK